ncbi:predicted protein [Uncinocarpus reesii 1704]|uniref:Uncharacterized protein n=1 Tax=Uncinocarpus reesii (strain UAMH 1704) TaxID=336963 RepID=C4JMK9_UNCRE|nr:uncharacterized protein UREG_04067 [Uncinocarpus reesii 1704]EEP79221.1 predicted protein [Uncinocarpus reesii 1704]
MTTAPDAGAILVDGVLRDASRSASPSSSSAKGFGNDTEECAREAKMEKRKVKSPLMGVSWAREVSEKNIRQLGNENWSAGPVDGAQNYTSLDMTYVLPEKEDGHQMKRQKTESFLALSLCQRYSFGDHNELTSGLGTALDVQDDGRRRKSKQTGSNLPGVHKSAHPFRSGEPRWWRDLFGFVVQEYETCFAGLLHGGENARNIPGRSRRQKTGAIHVHLETWPSGPAHSQ